MVVGEPQILGQLKAAYAVAKNEGTVGGLLETVITRAFNVAKRVRSETGIGQMAVSVSYAAVELARRIFGSLKGHSVLIIGSGKMGELAARHLRRSGATKIFVTNRTWERAEEFARVFEGTPIEYERFKSMLPEIDIVIASSGAPHYMLTAEEMRRVIAARKNKPVFLIDIAVPRNIDPAVNERGGRVPLRRGRSGRRGQREHQGAREAGGGGGEDRNRRSGADDGAAEDRAGHAHHRQPAGTTGRDSLGGGHAHVAQAASDDSRTVQAVEAAIQAMTQIDREQDCARADFGTAPQRG